MSQRNLKKSLFITFEGGEGSGKTSLLDSIYDKFKQENIDCIKTRAPGGTKLGQKVREILLHTDHMKLCEKAELMLFLADRAQLVQEVIEPHLQRQGLVLCDRFTDSTLAYQGASREGLNIEEVKSLALSAAGGLVPQLTLYLDIDPKIGLQRAKKAITTEGKASFDRLEEERFKFHENVRKAYLDIAQKEPERVKVLDASKSKELVLKEAIKIIQGKFEELW